jgi:hypothetical protein
MPKSARPPVAVDVAGGLLDVLLLGVKFVVGFGFDLVWFGLVWVGLGV